MATAVAVTGLNQAAGHHVDGEEWSHVALERQAHGEVLVGGSGAHEKNQAGGVDHWTAGSGLICVQQDGFHNGSGRSQGTGQLVLGDL